VLTIALITVILISLFAINEWFSNHQSTQEFFVGVEFAYGNASDLKALVDKVKNYTNLFVIGSLEISFNQTALNEACDYIVDAGLHFIVLFTDSTKYNYTIFVWMEDAKQKYGDKFLGVYRYDEPGGNQLDQGSSMLVENATDYADASANYTEGLGIIVEYYLNYTPKMFTADYGLYWFDYKAGYSAVFAEFGWNHSRQLNIALCRGAAKVQNRDWGVIVTWKYNNMPYVESPEELYSDMTLAFRARAKYLVVFNYPKTEPYGILTEEHFDALKRFWNYTRSNLQDYGVDQGEVAYVVPADYGFGFRSASDNIWGLFDADELSPKIWNDVNKLLSQYGSRLDVVYNDPVFINAIKARYEKLFFWNETLA
jgi:hypothetical protein